jgi:predicted O-methyltransferase YrrM
MDSELQTLITNLEQFGEQNDKDTPERRRRMRNITHETGEFLAVLVRAIHPKKILEIGTSNGYSTLWLADAVRTVGGTVTTVELSEYKFKLARENFARSGLESWIQQVRSEGGNALENTAESAYDMIFLDSDRNQYVIWWADLQRILKPGGLLVVDNATSHAEEMQPFVDVVKADIHFTTDLVPVGKGEFLAVKSV